MVKSELKSSKPWLSASNQVAVLSLSFINAVWNKKAERPPEGFIHLVSVQLEP